MKFHKIIIVGGGSAGWMTAATFIKCFPKKNIILIESPNYPIIGVGESTISGIRSWTDLLELNDKEFMKSTDATYKLSIRFENFYKKGDQGFHYPFGHAFVKNNKFGNNDWYFKKIFFPDLPVTDYAESYYPQMALVKQNKICDNKNGKLENFRFYFDTAFHFDATKFGLWLKEYYCLPRGVKYISEHIKTVECDENGVVSLNKKHKADLFIDCTGFKSLLLSETLKEPFESFTHILPNNKAWAVRIPYENKEKELNTYTDCFALNNGWVWTIPLWNRLGTGYVYSDKYISDENALKEFKNHLNRKNIDKFEFNHIKMRVGLHKRLFVKNVCAIGLAAGFIEPLESNGLYTVHTFLMHLMKVLNRGNLKDISQFDKDTFNTTCLYTFKKFAEFVALHYALTHRDDTPYWKEAKNKTYDYLNNFYYSIFERIMNNKMIDKFYDLREGYSAIASGMNYFPLTKEDLYADGHFSVYGKENLKEYILKNVTHLDLQKEKWNHSIKNEKSIYDYLKENIYNED
jgi:tryptophan halogenase